MPEAIHGFSGAGSSLTASEHSKASRLARMLFLSLACLIAISILSIVNLYSLRKAGWWRNHTHIVIEQIETVEGFTSLAGAWYQMFQSTGDTGGLWRSERELRRAAAQVRTLRTLVADNPSQQERLARLEQQIDIWLREKYVHPNRSQAFLNAGAILHEMRNQEQDLLAQRSNQMEIWRAATFWLNCTLLLFALLALAFLWRKWLQEDRWTNVLLTRLSEAEARFQAFMDHSPLLAFIKTRESRLIYSNQPRKRLIGNHADPSTRAVRAEDLADGSSRHDRRVFESNEPHEFVEELALPDGSSRWFHIVLFPFSIGNESTLLG